MKNNLFYKKLSILIISLLLCFVFITQLNADEPLNDNDLAMDSSASEFICKPFKIQSLSDAYDKLIVTFFKNDYHLLGILSKVVATQGDYIVETSQKKVKVGSGPGWGFYYKDNSRTIIQHYVFLITENGQFYQKILDEPPLDIDLYHSVIRRQGSSITADPTLSTADQAYKWLVHTKLGHTISKQKIYVFSQKIKKSVTVVNMVERFTFDEGPGWLFFVDSHPHENWGHPCISVFVTERGQCLMRGALFPPKDMTAYRQLTEVTPEPSSSMARMTTANVTLPARTFSNATSPENRWAVIISGGISSLSNHSRYWNDCSFFYKTLIQHGFADDHIYVLISDGTNDAPDKFDGTNSSLDLDGDGDPDTQYSATPANIATVFNILQGNLDGDDILYIFTTDHGNNTSKCSFNLSTSQLILWGSSITDVNFALEVNKVQTLATVCVCEQCFSGGMIDNLEAPNRVLMSSSRFWESSKMGTAGTGSEDYDEYSYHLTYALSHLSEADRNQDNAVSFEEAHFYAMAHDSKQSEDLVPKPSPKCDYNPGEHQSYYSNPWDLGRKISLFGFNSDANPSLWDAYTQTEINEPFPVAGQGKMNWNANNQYWSYDLPFSFPFFGNNYNKLYVETNGIIYLSDPGQTDYENSVNKLKTKLAIAPLWDDLHTLNGGDIFCAWEDPWLTIRWQAYTVWDSPDRPVNFAVKLNRNGIIQFLYGSGNDHTSLIKQRDKTIGISKGTGNKYILCLRNGSANLNNAKGIQFTPYNYVYVDGSWTNQPQVGTLTHPFQFLSDANADINNGEDMYIKAGSYNTPKDVPIVFDKNIMIRSRGGNVIIGE